MAAKIALLLVLLRIGLTQLALLQAPTPVAAWGADGHHITCLLAEPLLTVEATAGVKSLLPEYANGSLASLCTWPDDIRWMWKWHWTSPLHYIDAPDFYCNYNYARDCHDEKGHVDFCVAGGINNYSSQLLTYHASSSNSETTSHLLKQQKTGYNLTEALLFLSHFLGDIHQESIWVAGLRLNLGIDDAYSSRIVSIDVQPLHVANTGDAGGNTIILHWYTRKYNLHHVWDNEFINRARDYIFAGDLSAFRSALHVNITTSWLEESAEWAKCPDEAIVCPDVYASESIRLACLWAYRNATPGSTLKDDYFFSRLPIVERQLARGAVRLAATLNRIFSSKSASLVSML